jgi:hypothetical protein
LGANVSTEHQKDISARFECLLTAVCDEVATEEEFSQLQEFLRRDPQALAKYVSRLQLCANLYSVAEDGSLYQKYLDLDSPIAEFGGGACEQWASKKSAHRRLKFLGWRSLFTLAALLSAVVLFNPSLHKLLVNGTTRSHTDGNSLAPFGVPAIAYMTSTNGCDWNGAAPWVRSANNGVQVGDEIALNEGIAEFRLESGVYLSLEGPAGLVLTSPNSLVLQYGKITVKVPWPNRDYRILAGACRIETADAEFGVWVTGGRTDIHVFSGNVMASNGMMSISESGQPDADQSDALVASRSEFTQGVVPQGRAIAVDNRRNVMRVTHSGVADPSLFATKLSMAGPLPVSKAYVDGILADGPKGYWRFESETNGMIRNEVSSGPGLSVVGDVRLVDFGGNRVAELAPGANCYLFTNSPMDVLSQTDYSFEVWVKPSHVHFGTILGLCRSEPSLFGNAFLLEVQGSNQLPGRPNFGHPSSIRFLHRDPPDRSARLGTNCFSSDPYTVRRWQHLVAVKRGSQIELYVNGNLEAQATEPSTLASNMSLIVGRQARSVDQRLQFIGQLDEVAVYSRALTLQQIRAHYRMIDWTQTKKLPLAKNSS